ncbi:MAG: glycoside hydrolase family 2 protein, partial [Phycisphaerae bacterium]|nr:glycoside hydrolase family 2 protein [Phycisphaerae bacterium]
MMKTNLSLKNWVAKAVGNLDSVPEVVRDREIPAVVPGCIHTDLLQAGLIEDPYIDRNELDVQWIGHTDWQYQCTFEVGEDMLGHDCVELVCDGLDTIATLEINGRCLGEAANMHNGYRFDAMGLLKAGENELKITFDSAVRYARRMRDELGELPRVLELEPFNFIRKMSCNFGWDWGPTLVTCGIWKSIRLEAWNSARIASVRPLVREADPKQAMVEVLLDVDRAADATDREQLSATVVLTGPDGTTITQTAAIAEDENNAMVSIRVDNPELWWPRGYGEQPLYDVTVSLHANRVGEKSLDDWSSRIGMRTVRLNTDSDEIGAKFQMEINGTPIFCKGANWIPDDCFITRIDDARYRRRIEQAAESNMNMLRVWGGGIYETDTFYRLCDEMGIMVWQDFLFACALYPEEEPLRTLVEAEARHNITRLCPHPSLVIWDGCNENIWAYLHWPDDGVKWKKQAAGRTWGEGFYFDLLPRLVNELDSTRPYWPGSPYSGSMDIHPLDDDHGNKHVWEPWFEKNYRSYRNHTPRFASEFGFQGPPAASTLKKSIPADQLVIDSPAMLHHQKCPDGNLKINTYISDDFGNIEHFSDWTYLAQLNQARALTCAVEWFRSLQPRCMGSLYWQLNDCWPVTSWAAVDGDGKPKPMWYATRRFYADHLLTIQPAADGKLCLYAINDTDQTWSGNASIMRMGFDGRQCETRQISLDVPARSCVCAYEMEKAISSPDDKSNEFIVAGADDIRATWFFDIDKKLAYPKPEFDAELTRNGSTYRLTISAESMLRDIAVFADRLDDDAKVNDQLITLLPGESFTFVIESDKQLTREMLTST